MIKYDNENPAYQFIQRHEDIKGPFEMDYLSAREEAIKANGGKAEFALCAVPETEVLMFDLQKEFGIPLVATAEIDFKYGMIYITPRKVSDVPEDQQRQFDNALRLEIGPAIAKRVIKAGEDMQAFFSLKSGIYTTAFQTVTFMESGGQGLVEVLKNAFAGGGDPTGEGLPLDPLAGQNCDCHSCTARRNAQQN